MPTGTDATAQQRGKEEAGSHALDALYGLCGTWNHQIVVTAYGSSPGMLMDFKAQAEHVLKEWQVPSPPPTANAPNVHQTEQDGTKRKRFAACSFAVDVLARVTCPAGFSPPPLCCHSHCVATPHATRHTHDNVYGTASAMRWS